MIKKLRNIVQWTYVVKDFNGEEIAETIYERNEKAIRRKVDRLYLDWKGYDNSFKSWINMKDIVQK